MLLNYINNTKMINKKIHEAALELFYQKTQNYKKKTKRKINSIMQI